MAAKHFCLKVHLNLHAITCPGVWLCPNGKVALQINIFNSCTQSHRITPVFPLLFHNKLTFKKIFTRVTSLTDLQHNLRTEYVHAELVQWIKPHGQGIILATFQTNLLDLLYPEPSFKGLLPGVDIDLLMEPTKYFPGIIAPKIEISTKTIIEEVLGVYDSNKTDTGIVNPKVIESKRAPSVQRKKPVKGIIRQQRVCHSHDKPKSQTCSVHCPMYCNTEDLYSISRCCCMTCKGCVQPQVDQCYHSEKRTPMCTCQSTSQRVPHDSSICDALHIFDSCPVCSKYKCYFSRQCEDRVIKKKTNDHYN